MGQDEASQFDFAASMAEASRAAEETPAVTEEAVQEEPEVKEPEKEEVLPEEPEDNKDRSKLGRKVADIERNINALIEKLDSVFAKKLEPEEPILPNPDEILTAKEALELFERVERKKQEAQLRYEQDYIGVAKSFDDENHEDVFKEMMDNFNVRYSDNPKADAEKNYALARTAVLQKKIQDLQDQLNGKRPPLKGEKPTAPLGVHAPSKKVEPVRAKPQLDQDMQYLVEALGIKESTVNAALEAK